LFDDHRKFAEQAIEGHWQAVEMLVEQLLAHKTMPKSEAFGLIEAYLAKNYQGQ